MTPRRWIQNTDLVGFRRAVRRWYGRHARRLPWRGECDPYRIWVSEVMLQQTQAATVVAYYDRFLSRFPTLASLARASEEEVLRAWEGLGYYARARNLLRAARIVVRDHGGKLPGDPAELERLPGVGRYIARAIGSLAFGRRHGILEANTVRLWSRLCAAEGDPSRAPLRESLWEVAQAVLPRRGSGEFNQALMDLGAGVCTPNEPLCSQCPLPRFCQAFQRGITHRLPQPSRRRPTVVTEHVGVVLWSGQRVLVRRRDRSERWGGLWEFPSGPKNAGESGTAAAQRLLRDLDCAQATLGRQRIALWHSIMHYRVHLRCWEAFVDGRPTPPRCRWVRIDQLSGLPLSAPQRRVAEELVKEWGPAPSRSSKKSPRRTPCSSQGPGFRLSPE